LYLSVTGWCSSGIFISALEVAMIGNMSRKIGLVAFGASLFVAACSSAPTKDEVQSTVSASQTTFTNFHNDPDMTWFRNNVGKAKAILISPDILQAGFVVGGSSGKAVLLAKSDKGWSDPAFYRVSTGSVGLQAGAQSSEMVGLVMNEKALNSLLSSSVKLGGDMSFAVGPTGSGAGSEVTADMVVYVRSKGLYGGLNLTGTAITISDDTNKAYYGQAVTPVDILVKHTAHNPGAQSLVNAVSTYAK
jgi:lipid-binding SYLF domain-containing protein